MGSDVNAKDSQGKGIFDKFVQGAEGLVDKAKTAAENATEAVKDKVAEVTHKDDKTSPNP